MRCEDSWDVEAGGVFALEAEARRVDGVID